MIYWIKKIKDIKKSFKEISKDFIKNDFKLMILNYFLTKKESIYFLNFVYIQFSKKVIYT